jgi:polysaccharide export outer membrane protein
MKKWFWIVVAVALVLCPAANSLAAGEPDPSLVADYAVGPGDVLTISVWKDESLTRQVVVLPDGKIAFPLVGQLPAAGRTVAEITRDLEQKLERFVPGVTLSVVVQQVNSLMVYVIGRVNNPGRFVLNSDINVLQALAMAGGLNPFAKRGDIKIFREAGGGTKVMFFDYDKVSDGEEARQNIKLRRGDVIVVP